MDGNYSERPDNEKVIIDEVIAKRDFLQNLGKQTKTFEIFDRIAVFGKKLLEKYPDAKQCYLWHVMSYSNIDRNGCTRLDFPGEDSVVKFLNDLVEEYKAE